MEIIHSYFHSYIFNIDSGMTQYRNFILKNKMDRNHFMHDKLFKRIAFDDSELVTSARQVRVTLVHTVTQQHAITN